MPQKYRAQILLEAEQHVALQEIAHRQGQSISEVARQVIRLGLEAIEKDENVLWRRRMLALEKLNQIRQSIQEKHGVYQGNLIEQARAERDHQLSQASDWGQME